VRFSTKRGVYTLSTRHIIVLLSTWSHQVVVVSIVDLHHLRCVNIMCRALTTYKL
jgi:hypothetical protein